MENEFYEFARDHFQFVKERTLTYNGDRITGMRPKQFHYEKIRPRRDTSAPRLWFYLVI